MQAIGLHVQRGNAAERPVIGREHQAAAEGERAELRARGVTIIEGLDNEPQSGRNAKEAGAVTVTINDIRGHKDLKQLGAELHAMASNDVDCVYLRFVAMS